MSIRLAVLTPADIARNRFMPALLSLDSFEYAGVGKHSESRAQKFVEAYPGKVYDSYDAVLDDKDVEAVYIPLPPTMHYEWAKKAIMAGKHVLLEKPFAASWTEAQELVELARERGLALHENYMFPYHKEIDDIAKLVADGTVGRVRLYRVNFGFPRRPVGDFRYNPAVGGGAFLDAGGYCVKYASLLLGDTAKVVCAIQNSEDVQAIDDGKAYGDSTLDLYGSGTMINDDKVTVQFAYGMDQNYKCDIEVWGSTGTLLVKRVLTAPPTLEPTALIDRNGQVEEIKLSADDAFRNSILRFERCILDDSVREENYKIIMTQAKLSEEFRKLSR